MLISIILDRITKYLAIIYLKDQKPLNIIPNILEFTYLENKGAAFGIFQEKQIFFYIITIIVLIIIGLILVKMPSGNKYLPLELSLSFISGGAIGNFIDRISSSYVVDFIYFKPIDFPVFNVADIFVTLATIWLVILLIFIYKDEDLSFLKINKKVQNEKRV